jgi:hypothetical protein
MATKKTKVELSAETSKYEKSMRNVRRESKKTAQSIKSSFTRIAGSLGKIGALATLAGVGGFAVLAKEALDTGDKIHKLNLRLGLSTEALSQLQHVADLSGVEFMTVAKSIQKMQENISDAAQGIGTAKDSLKDINLNFMWLKSLSPEKQFEAIADAMLGVANQSDKVRIAADIFGGRGIEMLQIMSEGAAGIRKMREEADRLGITLSQEGAQAIADANDSMARIQASIKGVTRSLIVELAPGIEDVSGKISDWVVLNKGLIEQKVPEYLGKIETSLSKIWGIIQYDPAIIKYGLVGLAFFGKKGAVIGGALGHATTWAENFSAALGLVAAGIVDAKDVASANFKELEEIVKRAERMMAGPTFYKVSWPEPDKPKALPGPLPETIPIPVKINFEAIFESFDPKIKAMEFKAFFESFSTEIEAMELKALGMMAMSNADKLALQAQFNQEYADMGKSQFDLERDQIERMKELYLQAGIDKEEIAELTSEKIKAIAKAETEQRLSFYQSMASGIANTFMQIAQVGGKSSKEAFRLYQGFAITEAIIAANLAAAKVLGQTGIFGIPLSSMVWGMAMANVAMIAAAKPPSYDEGGISRTAGIYQTGNIPEAHIPLKGGAVPVHLDARRAGGINVTNNFIMNNPVFQDLETQQQTMALIADTITKNVAPGAIVQNYNDDGIVRQMVRGGL